MSNNKLLEPSVSMPFADFPPFSNPPMPLARQPPTELGQTFPVNCICISCKDDQGSSEYQEDDERLDEEETLELIEYKDAWKPFIPTLTFLKNRSVSPEEREPIAIMKDFPEPKGQSLKAPKLDTQLQSQIVGQLPGADGGGGSGAASPPPPAPPPPSGPPPPVPPGNQSKQGNKVIHIHLLNRSPTSSSRVSRSFTKEDEIYEVSKDSIKSKETRHDILAYRSLIPTFGNIP